MWLFLTLQTIRFFLCDSLLVQSRRRLPVSPRNKTQSGLNNILSFLQPHKGYRTKEKDTERGEVKTRGMC